MLQTSDGTYTFTEENILSVALGALIAQDRNEFERITGFYGGGYKSEIRHGMYHGKGCLPMNFWRREMRRLYGLIKNNAGDVQLPGEQAYQQAVKEFQVKDFFEDQNLVPANAWQMSNY
jgi:hypothetical protein